MDPSSTQLLSAAQVFAPYNGALAVYSSASPYVNVYAITAENGFGVKYSDPSTLQTSGSSPLEAHNMRFSSDGNFLVTGQSASPFINAWSFTLGTGFGAKFSDPITLPGSAVTAIATKRSEQGVNTQYIVASYANNLISYYVDAAGGFQNAQIKSTPEFPSGALSLAFHPTGNFLFAQNYGLLRSYTWANSSSGGVTRIGSALATPTPSPGGAGHGDIHPAGTWYAGAVDSFNLVIYPFVSGFGGGTTYNTGGATAISSIRFSPSGFSIIGNKFTFRNIEAFRFNGATGAVTSFGAGGTANIFSILNVTYESTIAKTGDLVAAVGVDTSSPYTYVVVFPFSDATGFGTRLANPVSMPSSACYSCDFL